MSNPHEFFESPAWATRRLFDMLDETHEAPSKILEPCAGHGSIVRAVNAWWSEHAIAPEWMLVELRTEARQYLRGLGRLHIGDFFAVAKALEQRPHEAIVMNPPFGLGEEFVEACVKLARSWKEPGQVFALLPLNFIATEKRAQLYRRIGTPSVYVLPNRPDFTGGGGDRVEYGWFHWSETKSATGTMRVLASTPRAERKLG